MTRLLRIFISSPGDVIPERRRAALVVEKLAKDYARFFDIRPYLWETEPMLASGTFQDAIIPPGEADILLLILWARLGTLLPKQTASQEYRGIDGRSPVTGTEWEYETALAAFRARGAPDLLAYKKGSPPQAEYRSDADLDELRAQLQRLDAFWKRHFVDQGEFRAAFGEFQDLDGFEKKLEGDLRRLIERRVASQQNGPDRPSSQTWVTGSPFRGLETYRFEHAPIFFGRSEATKTAVEQLVTSSESGRPFLLVLGASGAGKSSLTQAGILPALSVRGVVPGVGIWRRAVIRPAGHPGGPFMALAAGICDENALPELAQAKDVAALARHLETAAADPGFPIVSSLIAREHGARQSGELLAFEEIRLIIVIDQLEELFTLNGLTSDQRRAFMLCIKGLVNSGRVFVIASMRSDYWHRAAEVPLLVALAEGHGRLDLLSANQAEITEMIRRPAEVAGLSFETDARTEIRLDAALAEEAAREPGALPLLSFLLDALYAVDALNKQDSVLGYESMHRLGGLRGAIATRAETAFKTLSLDAQRAFPKVLRTLVTVGRSGADPTSRPVPMAYFSEGSPERHVVDAFLDPQVRLLVADGDGTGARVRLAHEALITHWERARNQIIQDRDDLRTRALVEEAEKEWRAAATRDRRGYLLRDPQLANAIDLTNRWGQEVDTNTREFIAHSKSSARRRLMAAAALLIALTAGFAGLAGYAFLNREQAIASRNQAQKNEKLAIANETRGLASLSRVASEDGHSIEAVKLALAAWPRDVSDVVHPQFTAALDSLSQALALGDLPHAVLRTAAIKNAFLLGGDSPRIVLQLDGGGVRILNTDGKDACQPIARQQIAMDPTPARAGGMSILYLRSETSVYALDPVSCRQVGPSIEVGSSQSFNVSRDNRNIIGWSRATEEIHLWDIASGQPVGPTLKKFDIANVITTPSAQLIGVGGSGLSTRWIFPTGEMLQDEYQPTGGSPTVGMTSLDDGTRVVAWSDQRLYSWDISGAQATGINVRTQLLNGVRLLRNSQRIIHWGVGAMTIRDPQTLDMLTEFNSGFVDGIDISDDERLVISWARYAGTVRLWDSSTGKQIGSSIIGSEVLGGRFLADGRQILIWSARRLSVWDVATGEQIGPSMDSNEDIAGALVVPDGSRISAWSKSGSVMLWNRSIGTRLESTFKREGGLEGVTVSADKTRVAAWSKGKVYLLDATSGFSLGVINSETEIAGIAFANDNDSIFTYGKGKLQLWNARTGTRLIEPMLYENGITDFRIFDHNRKIILIDSSFVVPTASNLRIWDAATGKPLAIMRHDERIFGMTLSANERELVSWSANGKVRHWSVETGDQIGATMVHDEAVLGAIFVDHDRRIISGGDDFTVRAWDASNGEPIGQPVKFRSDTDSAVYGLPLKIVLLDDEKRVLVQTQFDLHILNWSTLADTIPPMEGSDKDFIISEDESRIVSPDKHGVRIWDTATGKQIGTTMTHPGLEDMRVSADNERILTWSYDQLRVWEASTGLQIGPTIPVDRIEGARFLDDGHRVLSYSGDNIRIWDFSTGRELGPAMKHVDVMNGDRGVMTISNGNHRNRILSWSNSYLRFWNIEWPRGSLFEVACRLLPDYDLNSITHFYGVSVGDELCNSQKTIPLPRLTSE